MAILQTICDIIILMAAVTVAITNILKFIGRPLSFFQKKQQDDFDEKFKQKLDEELPKALEKNQEQLSSIISKDVMPILSEIREMNAAQNEKIEAINNSSKDVLRDKIMDIYNYNKKSKSMTRQVKRRLDQYYKDYRGQNGNSYIEDYYKIMCEWKIIEED